MKLARTGIIAAAVLSVTAIAFAQAKPDFTGTWTPEQAPNAQGEGRGRGGMMGPMTIKMSGDTLTIERQGRGGTQTETYKLDGTETVSKRMMGRGENAREVEVKSTAKWDGDKLVITNSSVGPDGTPRTQTQTWSLKAGDLVIEAPAGRGGEMRTIVYKKST